MPRSQILASKAEDHLLKLWDAGTDLEPEGLCVHPTFVECLAIDPGGRSLSSGDDSVVEKLWDVESVNELGEISGLGKKVIAVTFSTNGWRRRTMRNSRKPDRRLSRTWGQVAFATHSRRPPRAERGDQPGWDAARDGGVDRRIRRWNQATGQEMRSIGGCALAVFAAPFSRDEIRLASGGDKALIRVG